MATNRESVINDLLAQGYTQQQAEVAWNSVPTDHQFVIAAAKQDALKFLVANHVTPQPPTNGSGGPAVWPPGSPPIPGTQTPEAVRTGAQATLDWALHTTGQQTSKAPAPRGTIGLSDTDLTDWMTSGAPIGASGTSSGVMDQSMPSTTRSLYSTPVGIPGAKIPTVRDQMVALAKLSKDDLIRMQQKLVEGGYYPSDAQTGSSRPQWGTLDANTYQAFSNLVRDAIYHPNMGMNELIDQAGGRNLHDLATQRQDKVNQAAAVALANAGVTGTASLTATADLVKAGLDAAEAGIGRRLTGEEQQRFVDSFHSGEAAKAQTKYDAIVAKAKAGAQGVSDTEVDRFLNAVQNGDGSGQFVRAPGVNQLGMDATQWSKWADKVGLPSNAAQTPENLHLVGREIALDLYGRYGNWQDAATAWFAGPGSSSAWAPGTPTPSSTLQGAMSQFDTSVQGRVDVVTRAMRQGSDATAAGLYGAGVSAGGPGGPLSFTEDQPSPGAAAELYVQQNMPVEYVGHSAAARAKELFDFIGQPGANLAASN